MHKILIVEDDADNNQMLCDYLESHGYACAQAYSGSEGKLLFSMEHFDLVLLDLMLPGIPGEELVPLFAQKSPVIVLSAKSGLDSRVDVLQAEQMITCASRLTCLSCLCGFRCSCAGETGNRKAGSRKQKAVRSRGNREQQAAGRGQLLKMPACRKHAMCTAGGNGRWMKTRRR